MTVTLVLEGKLPHWEILVSLRLEFNKLFRFTFSAKATFAAIGETFKYLTPDMWPDTKLTKPPYQEYTDYLSKNYTKPQATTKPPEA